MNTEERQLADLLHRVTPEPPRRVTVEDVAFRLANEAGQGRQARVPRLREPRRREPHRRRPSWGRAWAPALAAAAVVVVAGGSAALAVGLTSNSHHGGVASPGSKLTSSSAAPVTSSASTAPAVIPTSAVPIKDAPYGAELINRDKITPGTLVSGDNYLYGVEPGYLDQIDPANGTVVHRMPDTAQVVSAPVIVGDQVWAVTAYTSAGAVLTGYNAVTLTQVASVQVPVTGRTSFAAAGVLAGANQNLYLAAGNDIAVVNTDTHKMTRQFVELQGPINSLATSPDGTRLYVSLGNVTLVTYELPGLATLATSTVSGDGAAANLVATSGGVWGTMATQTTTTAWFAPGGNLAKLVHVGDVTGTGAYSVPTYGGGAVWIGGSQTLVCASPASGQVLATASIPRDGSAAEYLGGVAVSGSRAYASYSTSAAQQSGTAVMAVPSACSG